MATAKASKKNFPRFRADATRKDRFPSLFAAGRPSVGRPKKLPGNGTAPAGEPEVDATPATEPVVSQPA